MPQIPGLKRHRKVQSEEEDRGLRSKATNLWKNNPRYRSIPTDDKSLYTAVFSLEQAADEGDTEEMERLEGLIGIMHRLRGDSRADERQYPPWLM